MFSKSKDKEKFVILQSIGMIWIKIKETREAANTSRYSSGLLIPNSATTVWNIGINCLLEYLQVLATTLVSLHFIYMIPIDCKITYFSLYIPVMYVILIPQALVLCLIYTHKPEGRRPEGACIYIRQGTSACGISAMYHIAHAGW